MGFWNGQLRFETPCCGCFWMVWWVISSHIREVTWVVCGSQTGFLAVYEVYWQVWIWMKFWPKVLVKGHIDISRQPSICLECPCWGLAKTSPTVQNSYFSFLFRPYKIWPHMIKYMCLMVVKCKIDTRNHSPRAAIFKARWWWDLIYCENWWGRVIHFETEVNEWTRETKTHNRDASWKDVSTPTFVSW